MSFSSVCLHTLLLLNYTEDWKRFTCKGTATVLEVTELLLRSEALSDACSSAISGEANEILTSHHLLSPRESWNQREKATNRHWQASASYWPFCTSSFSILLIWSYVNSSWVLSPASGVDGWYPLSWSNVLTQRQILRFDWAPMTQVQHHVRDVEWKQQKTR